MSKPETSLSALFPQNGDENGGEEMPSFISLDSGPSWESGNFLRIYSMIAPNFLSGFFVPLPFAET